MLWKGLMVLTAREILSEMYSSLGGPQWKNSNNWNTNSSVSSISSWYGVTTTGMGDDEKVTHIDLSDNFLKGQLPFTIGLLTDLISLNLTLSLISGPIPDSIFDLTRLRELNLSYTHFGGSLSPRISNLKALETLDLTQSGLSQGIPSEIGLLTSLHYLSLSDNSKLFGTLPDTLASLTELEELNLGSCGLVGKIPADIFGGMSALREVSLSSNSLSGSLPQSYPASLMVLDVSTNDLSGTIPSSLAHLSNLKELRLTDNNLSGSLPVSASWSLMETLAAESNNMTSTLPSYFGGMPFLKILRLHSNNLTGWIPQNIVLTTSLTVLDLRDNSFSGPLPRDMDGWTSLLILNVMENSLSGPIPSSITAMSQLAKLQLRGNRFTGTIPLFMHQTLDTMMLSKNQLSGTLPVKNFYLSRFTTASVSYNHLTGPLDFSALDILTVESSYLTQLDVEDNDLTGPLPNLLCSFPILTELYVGGNNFSCFPMCLTVGDSEIFSEMRHCVSNVDVTLCEMASSGSLRRAVQNLIIEATPVVVESEHLSTRVSSNSFTLPVFNSYTMHFDRRTSFGDHTVEICTDEFCKFGPPLYTFSSETGWPGVGATPSVTFSGVGDYFAVETPRSTVWGFKITIRSLNISERGWSCQRVNVSDTHNEIHAAVHSSLSLGMSSLSTTTTTNAAAITASTGSYYYADSYCTWHGVTCVGGIISRIDLSTLQISGQLPAEIGALTSLTSLDLSYNKFTGRIPPSWQSLRLLTSLDLTSNDLTGPLFESIPTNWTSLTMLSLASNHFTRTLPAQLNNFSQLSSFFVGANDLSGPLSDDLCKFTGTVDVINVVGNAFSCYESCWGSKSSIQMDSDLMFCSPTIQPTVASTNMNYNISWSLTDLIGTVVGCVILLICCLGCCAYAFRSSKHTKYRGLPLHLSVIDGVRISPQMLQLHMHTVAMLDPDGKNVVELILDKTLSSQYFIDKNLFLELVLVAMSSDADGDVNRRSIVSVMSRNSLKGGSKDENNQDFNYHTWCVMVQHSVDLAVETVRRILAEGTYDVDVLANCLDKFGRRSVDIASPRCRNLINRSTYLHRRYELRPGNPIHKSATSVVRLALDHGEDQWTATNEDLNLSQMQSEPYPVALKMMKFREQFLKEVSTRQLAGFDNAFVMAVLRWYDGDATDEVNERFRISAISKGMTEYAYCVVMDVADVNLKSIIDQQHIVGEDWDEIKHITKRVAQALGHIHSKGFMHGDVKPMNIVRVGHSIRIIDLDAACQIDADPVQYAGGKYSSAYSPPELIHISAENGLAVVRAPPGRRLQRSSSVLQFSASSSAVDSGTIVPIPASSAHDMWALGALLYLLCTGMTLFQANVEDNIGQADLKQLGLWTDEVKYQRLFQVENRLARHLLSLLLCADPTRRLTAARVLEHPFLTGRTPRRLEGESPGFDVFLSYRVDSDAGNVEELYNVLVQRGLKVWWDKKCLEPGQPWEEGFCFGLVDSACFVCLLSGLAINHPTKSWQNFSKLEASSRCDNVLLEWRLALELKERGMIEGVFPVFIGNTVVSGGGVEGDDQTNKHFTHYFASGCHPVLPSISVDEVEAKLREHLDRAGLGLPFRQSQTVKEVVNDITANQGGFVEGDASVVWNVMADAICAMRYNCTPNTNITNSNTSSSPDQVDSCHQGRLGSDGDSSSGAMEEECGDEDEEDGWISDPSSAVFGIEGSKVLFI